MIWHFLKRDLKTYRFFWCALVISIAGMWPFVFSAENGIYPLLLAQLYFFFAMIPLQELTGVTWRSQHIMSRSYLLSLPVRRRSLFAIVQLRALVFWLPLLAFGALCPLFNFHTKFILTKFGISYSIYVLTLLTGAAWFCNDQIHAQLQWEKINAHLTMSQRVWAWIRLLLFRMIEMGVVGYTVFNAARIFTPLSFLVPAFLGVCIFFRARRQWVGG